MQTQITNAFADLDAKSLDRQITWFAERCKAVLAYYTSQERKDALGDWNKMTRAESSAVHDADERKLENLAGGKGWLAAVWMNHRTEAEQVAYVTKNIKNLVAKRDAQIIKALTKAGITEIPEFTLIEASDGFEGLFIVDGHRVTIRTILAGGYNIQCLHMRTLVRVK